MARIGGEQQAEPPSDLKVFHVMNNVLQLALQVSILEREMGKQLTVSLPGSHTAVKRKEYKLAWVMYFKCLG
jgi:hypothetical protein